MVTVTLTTLNLCSCPCSCCPHHIKSHMQHIKISQNIRNHPWCLQSQYNTMPYNAMWLFIDRNDHWTEADWENNTIDPCWNLSTDHGQPRLAPMLWWHWTLSSALSPLVSATSLDNLAKKKWSSSLAPIIDKTYHKVNCLRSFLSTCQSFVFNIDTY